MTNLKEINFGVNQFCGPAVLSALTGRNTDECAAVITGINGQTVIKAVAVKDLLEAFKRLRFDCIRVEGGRSLYGTLLRLLQSGGEGFYIVLVPKHVVAIEVAKGSVYLVDNHSKQPLMASSSARLMQKVEAVYKVVKKSEPVFVKTEVKAKVTDDRITILLDNIYENPSDNTIRVLGSFIYLNSKMLNDIVTELVKVVVPEARED